MVLIASSLTGCATGTSELGVLKRAVTLPDAVALGVGAYVIYRLSETPAWETKIVTLDKNKAEAILEKRAGSLGGDGSASFVFSQSAKKWCKQSGFNLYKTTSYIEFWEPTMLGAKLKAEGSFECLAD